MNADLIQTLSFNPCSGGLAVGTPLNNPFSMIIPSFNPCSGGLAVGTMIQRLHNKLLIVFQSLFWWISCWDSSF